MEAGSKKGKGKVGEALHSLQSILSMVLSIWWCWTMRMWCRMPAFGILEI